MNSGDPLQLARVVRELSARAATDPLPTAALAVYRTATSRLAQELAIIEQISEVEAAAQIDRIAPRSGDGGVTRRPPTSDPAGHRVGLFTSA